MGWAQEDIRHQHHIISKQKAYTHTTHATIIYLLFTCWMAASLL